MQFIYPNFLWALGLLAIPIIIHLFNFRRYKTVAFTNVALLQELQQSTRARSRIKEWILLATRILGLSAIILAFAGPYIPAKANQFVAGKKYIAIYLDNSLSMTATGKAGNLLQTGKELAIKVINSYGEGDAFIIIGNDLDGAQGRPLSREVAKETIQSMATSSVSIPLSLAYSRVLEGLRESGNLPNKRAYLISDFQRHILDGFNVDTSISLPVVLIPVQGLVAENVAIDSVWTTAPLFGAGLPIGVTVRLKNYGKAQTQEGVLNLSVNGAGKGLANFNLPPGGSADYPLSFTGGNAGYNIMTLSLGMDAIPFDNTLYATYNIPNSIPILLASQGTNARESLVNAYGAESSFKVAKATGGNIDYSALAKYKLIILDGITNPSTGLTSALIDALKAGSNVFIWPPKDNINLPQYNSLLATLGSNSVDLSQNASLAIKAPNKDEPFFANVFAGKVEADLNMPGVSRYYPQRAGGTSRARPLLSLANGLPFLSVSTVGQGKVYLSSVALDESYTSLSSHAIFLPILYRSALYGEGGEALYSTIGKDNSLRVTQSRGDQEGIYELTGDKGYKTIPPQRVAGGSVGLFVEGLVKDPGFYTLKAKGKDSILSKYAFNYPKEESQTNVVSGDSLVMFASGQSWEVADDYEDSQDFTASLNKIDNGVPWWKYLIGLGLVAFLAEVIVSRWKE